MKKLFSVLIICLSSVLFVFFISCARKPAETTPETSDVVVPPPAITCKDVKEEINCDKKTIGGKTCEWTDDACQDKAADEEDTTETSESGASKEDEDKEESSRSEEVKAEDKEKAADSTADKKSESDASENSGSNTSKSSSSSTSESNDSSTDKEEIIKPVVDKPADKPVVEVKVENKDKKEAADSSKDEVEEVKLPEKPVAEVVPTKCSDYSADNKNLKDCGYTDLKNSIKCDVVTKDNGSKVCEDVKTCESIKGSSPDLRKQRCEAQGCFWRKSKVAIGPKSCHTTSNK